MKTVKIEGMSCSHCSDRLTKVLNAEPGVTATVSLEERCARIEGEISDARIRELIEGAGFSVGA